MTTMNLLEINNLIIGFKTADAKSAVTDLQRDLIAVKGVSLSLAKGETLALVGESGCGKTVLCKSMLKLLCEKGRIHDGEIYFNGKDLVPLSEKEMRAYRGSGIAMVFQDPATALDPAFSVGQQIAEVLQLHKKMSRKAAEKRAVELLEKVQIPDALHRFYQRPYQFSGGMRQRAVIAMALAGEPQLLIADEPTTALDEDTQKEILRLLKEVQQDTGAAMLFITHDLSLVEEMADHVAVMKDGVIVERGAVDEIFAAPQHEYTRKLRETGSAVMGQVAADSRSGSRRLLSVENLTKSFPEGRRGINTVFRDFSMEIHKGEIIGLVGPSGCGKTTLARCIMGIEKPDAGKIVVENVPGSDDSVQPTQSDGDAATRIQMIFQDSATAFNDRMTVKEIVEEPLVIRRELRKERHAPGVFRQKSPENISESIRRAMEAAYLNYEEFAHRKPYELSGGQRQRVAIARALVTDPDIIIADEPLTGLDVTAQAHIAALFRKLADERGLAVLFITHDRQMVENVSDRTVQIRTGIQAQGSTDKALV